MENVPRKSTDAGSIPLATPQREIWLEHVLFPGSAVHTVGVRTDISGPLDASALEQALGLVWDRHQGLRLAVRPAADGITPIQQEAERPASLLARHDLSGEADPEAAADRLATALGQRAIPLDGGPTCRFDLIRLGPERHVWVMCYHHIAMDAWSNGILMRDVARAYGAIAAGKAVDLDPAPAYADFVEADAGFRDTPQFERNGAYWRALYDTLPERLVEAAPRVLRGLAPGPTLTRRIEVSRDILSGLREAAGGFGTTPAQMVIGGFLILEHLLTGARDLSFGMPMLNRRSARDKETHGLFSTVAAPRIRIEPEAGVAAVFANLSRAVRQAMRHHRYPLSEVNRSLGLTRRRVLQLFDVNISYEQVDYGEIAMGLARASVPRVLLNGVERTPIEIFVREYGGAGHIEIDLDFSLDHFSESEAGLLSERFSRVLSWLSRGAPGGLNAAPLLAAPERRWLVEEVNATARDYGPFVPVQVAFARHAAADPDALAVLCGEERLSYGELEARAAVQAARLRRLGVTRGAPVGVYLERSADLVVSLLAVLKAGGAYLPLDPELPGERLSSMLVDAAVPVVATSTALLDGLPAHAGRTLVVDDGGRARGGPLETALEVGSEDLAYVIYTSGSTGRPKGVMCSHGGLFNRLAWMQERFDLRGSDRVLQKTPFGFDVSVWEFFWPLMCGAAIVVARPGGHRDPDYLVEEMAARGVSVCHFVPSMLQALLGHEAAASDLGTCAALRLVMCSGEALAPAVVSRFYEMAPADSELHNLYGPTEAAIDVTHWACARPGEAEVPIGHAIANTQMYVLDAALEPVPVGVSGDLWIGGVQLARGYLGRPGLTAESFVADPFAADPGCRMYRTGDVARRRADGALDYLGRSDRQVKLRGMRIELGEIEARLLAHEAVREAAVLLREDREGDPRLAAYLATETGSLPEDLLAHLRRDLPDAMLPADYVLLAELPLSANGKLDRASLPAPAAPAAGVAGEALGPLEELVCAVFAAVLGRAEVGPEDDFFALGGHSLLAVQAAARLRNAGETHIPANAIFEHPTPRRLARNIQWGDDARPELVARDPKTARSASASELRLWFLQQQQPEDTAYNMTGTIDIAGSIDAPALARALAAVQLRHPTLHARYVEHSEGLFVEPCPAAVQPPAIETIADRDEAAAIARTLAASPFRLSEELPLRIRLLRADAERHLVVLSFHHIAADADSIRIFGEHLSQAYERARAAPDAAPAQIAEALPLSPGDALTADELAGTAAPALERWRQQLSEPPAPPELPRDGTGRAQPAGIRPAGEVRLRIDGRLRGALAQRAARQGATLFMLLHAGLATLLARVSGVDDLVIGSPVSMRADPALADTMGMLLNTLPLRLRIDEGDTCGDILEQARAVVTDALAGADVPLDRIVAAVRPGDDGARPLFQVLISTHAPHLGSIHLGEARVTARVVPQAAAKMDLVVLAADDGQEIEITLEYAADAMGDALAQRLADAYLRVLAAYAETPECAVGQIDLLDEAARQAEVAGAEAADSRPAPPGGIAAAFREIAARHADLPAIEDADGSVLRYGALDAASDRLAAGLVRQGVRPGDVVGLHLPRGVTLVTAMLAAIKAGAAYLPLDPDLPPQRLADMAEDAAAKVILSDIADSDAFAGTAVLPPEALDGAGGTPSSVVSERGDMLAYVMFTSGSTGRPKGIMVPHRAVLRLAIEPGFARFGPGKRVAQLATTAFDAATYEIWCALLNGGTTVIVPSRSLASDDELAAQLAGRQVASTFLTASVFNRAARGTADVFAGMEEVLFGGEAADPDAVRQAIRRWPDVRFANGYGPTETTTFAASQTADDVPDGALSVPIGRPIRATRLYVLDDALRPVPRGAVGELFIAGEGLAHGYANRPALTAEVFLADPFAPEPGARMYRTGDRVRRLADGSIDYLGRRDRQLKLRGYRIEPGEIEATLRDLSGGREAVVEVRGDGTEGENRALIAWLVGSELDGAREQELRAALGERLPGWMVPRRIVGLERLPLNANGKLDRAALPAPTTIRDAPASVPPEGPTEERLAEIWSALLDGVRVSRHDSFFALGGHSLLAVRLIAAIRDAFDAELPLRAIFDSPGLAALARAIETADRSGAEPAIPARAREDAARPISLGQLRLVLMDEIDGSGVAYTIPIALLFTGMPDVPALETALRALAERHEPLRTAIAMHDGIPEGRLLPADTVSLAIDDRSDRPEDAPATVLADAARALSRIPFDLETEPPLRARFLQFTQNRAGLVLVLHHVAADAASMPVLYRELARLYAEAATGRAAGLEPLALHYADWVDWRRERDESGALEPALDIASMALAGAPEVLELPTERARPPRRSHEGGLVSGTLAPGTGAALAAEAARHGTTTFAMLVAAYALVLGRLSGTSEVVLGIPFAGRDQTGLDPLIGFFADTAVLRIRIDDDPDPAALLARVHAELARALNDPPPFDRLADALAGSRDQSHTPVFQAMIALSDEPPAQFDFADLSCERLDVHSATAKFDLQLQVLQRGDTLRYGLEYAADLFSESEAGLLSERFSRVLSWLSRGAPGGLNAAPLLAAPERRWLVEEVNATARDYGPFVPVQVAFARHAAADPDALAVLCGEERLSYGELEARAAVQAARLRRLGVTRGAPVGVYLERSADLVVSLLAVLKAGGAYLPLDPELPGERLSSMLVDAAVPVVATSTALLDGLPAHAGRTLVVDDGGRARGGPLETALEVGSEDLAYVIYTSGSTGRPKGVMCSHGGLFNRLAWMQERFDLRGSDRVLQKTPFGFDVSVWEFFWPLMCGAAIVVARPGGHRDPDYLVEEMAARGVSVCHFVPSMLQALLGHEAAASDLGTCAALRLVMCSGEALAPAVVSRFYEMAPADSELHNLYGPTEAAIDVTHWACARPGEAEVPIGHAIANTQMYVLDAALEPVPVGVSGDLWIGGVQLARGYLGRPGLTAESFVADPFAADPGCRMYRTGDVARRRADGALDYLGRSDRQVKLRGMRIELGEIEARLLAHEAVREAAVLLREDREGDPRLAAYLATETGSLPEDLLAHLRRDLPDAMLPADYVLLAELPLSANGKLDRASLPAPAAPAAGVAGEALGPLEELVCAVFAAVLGRAEVGPEDDFFALGGHSLLAVQAAARLRNAGETHIPANAIFEHPTPRRLARNIQWGDEKRLEPISRRAADEPVVPSLFQRQMWFLAQMEGSAAYNVPDGFLIDGPLDVGALSAALQDVLARHEALRAVQPERDGVPVAEIRPVPPIVLAATQLEDDTDALDGWFHRQALIPFDIGEDIPFRAALAQLPDGRHALAVVLHHLATDGTSGTILYRDLADAYRARCAGTVWDKTVPDIQYFDWAAWQHRQSAGADMQARLRKLVERFADAPTQLDLPEDRPRTDRRAFEGAMLRVAVPDALSSELRERSRASSATLFMTLTAALGLLLTRLSGQDEVVIGAPASGRDGPELAETVGYFVNTVPLRLSAPGHLSVGELIADVRHTVLEAFADRDIPLDRLIEHLPPAQRQSRTPLFRVLLVLQPGARTDLKLENALVTPVNIDAVSARYDLTFAFDDHGQGLDLVLHYAADLFEPDTASRLAAQFLRVLEAIAEAPDRAVGTIALLDEAAQRAEVASAEAADLRPAPQGGIAGTFRDIAARHADLPAIEDADGSVLRYGALDAASDRLAAGLARHGVRPGDIVGLHLPRGVTLVTTMLAVIKAGAAYLPLDPELPPNRLADMAADTSAKIIVSDRTEVAELAGAAVLQPEALEQGELPGPPVLFEHGDRLAYTMFTSGSTGRPKGIMVPHRAVLRLAIEPGYARFAPGKRVAQLATTAFDAATYEIWCALLNGGTTVIVPSRSLASDETLATQIAGRQIASVFLTTSVFNRAARGSADVFSGVEEVLFGGEAADPEAVRRAIRHWPQVRFSNVYGPTETTTFASAYPVEQISDGALNVPIGRPIRATRLYVLDDALRPVPRGAAGELFIAGEGLAHGYVDRPALTAEAFLADPFAPEPGARMYRTGDRVRRLADGSIDYLGRRDRQLKLRGYRIEPGEIEAALRDLSGGREAVVEVHGENGESEDRALIAWLVGPALDGAGEQELRAALAERLPGWMVPRRIVGLERLPLNANGKLDRAALPAPSTTLDAPVSAPPEGPTEERLAELWSTLLDGVHASRHDDFFALGGHSLLAVRLIAAVREAFGVELPLRAIFDTPTLATLAKAIDTYTPTSRASGPIQRRARRTTIQQPAAE